MGTLSRREILKVGGLVALALIPAAAGVVRVSQVVHSDLSSENARFLSNPVPALLHIFGAIVFSVLGAFQFSETLRFKFQNTHRLLGRFVVIAGLMTSLSGLWMTEAFPNVNDDGIAVYIMRLIAGNLMMFSLILAVFKATKADFKSHGNWMIRAYALGMGAGTQVLTHIPLFLFPELKGQLARGMMMGSGWLINIFIAELVIRKKVNHFEFLILH